MLVDPIPWMPPDMPEERKQAWRDAYREDPHRAAAQAWEEWAGTLATDPVIQSASTGQQSVTYRDGKSAFTQAEKRAAWHRARAKAYTVETYSMSTPASPYLDGD